MKTDLRINEYIEKAQPFAQPILDEIRQTVHEFCPEVEETLKWKFPNFMYKGKILCSMASFKNHCSFGFWLGPLMQNRYFREGGMGDFGKMTNIEQLPDKYVFGEMIQEAMSLIDAGRTVPKNTVAASKIPTSEALIAALEKNTAARAHFEKFAPGQKKEYMEWISEAKTEATRNRRIETAIEWISEGKIRHWKYQTKK